jgi:hypothetical protein
MTSIMCITARSILSLIPYYELKRIFPMKTNLLFASSLLVLLAGCSTGIKRGQVVMKTSDRIAHVALATDEVNVGDHVELYHNECERDTGGGKNGASVRTNCRKVGTGHGVVTELFDADYAQVEFPDGTKFSEGDTIEKHTH